MKTSEVTPLPLYKFAALCKEAGFPAVSKIDQPITRRLIVMDDDDDRVS